MSGSWNPQDLPNLTPENYSITSPVDWGYNCIAWAVGDYQKWWWPTPSPNPFYYWPDGVPREESLEAFAAAYATEGFVKCRNGRLETNYEKVALYAKRDSGELLPTHASRQLPEDRKSVV